MPLTIAEFTSWKRATLQWCHESLTLTTALQHYAHELAHLIQARPQGDVVIPMQAARRNTVLDYRLEAEVIVIQTALSQFSDDERKEWEEIVDMSALQEGCPLCSLDWDHAKSLWTLERIEDECRRLGFSLEEARDRVKEGKR